MARLILHAGTHKTGTTTLQTVFERHRDWMRERGLYYPLHQPFKGRKAHLNLSHAIAEGTGPELKRADRFIRRMQRRHSEGETILLSSEAIYRHVDGGAIHLALDEDAYFAGRRAYLARFAEMLSEHDVEVVLCFRSFDYHMRHHLKTARRHGLWKGEDEAFMRDFSPRYDYDRQLDLFREVFAVPHVLSFKEGRAMGLASQFFQAIGFPTPPGADEVWVKPAPAGARRAQLDSAATPGSSLPSIHSRNAPPAVDT